MSESIKLSKTQALAFFAMVVGMFMAILDIQIVASSLLTIASGLAASKDELSWIQTAYLIAEVIIIPLTGFTARLLSIRISYFIAALGFTIMSVCCSLAWNIESMIVFRFLQGFFGGAMIPTVFATIYIIFQPKQRPLVTVIIGLTVTIAPTLGPILGGYITELLSWHFMFLLNIIPGIFVCTTVFLYADFDKPNYNLLKNFDYLGIFLMTVSLGCLQYILEEGNKRDWFEDTFLLFLGISVVFGFIALIIRELTFVNPILNLKSFANKNFSFGCVYAFVIGVGLYGAVYLLPLFLSIVAGLNSMEIGGVMMVTGAAQFLSAPIAGRLVGSGIDLRIMLAIGILFFGLGCYLNGFLTAESRYWELFIPQFIRGGSLLFCFIPMNNIALDSMSRDEVQNASGLFNLMRNLGGAIGIAAISSSIANKTRIFSQYFNENISYTSPHAQNALSFFNRVLSTSGKVNNPEKASSFLLSNLVNKNAFIMAINESFIIISMLFFISLIFIPLISKATYIGGNENAH